MHSANTQLSTCYLPASHRVVKGEQAQALWAHIVRTGEAGPVRAGSWGMRTFDLLLPPLEVGRTGVDTRRLF